MNASAIIFYFISAFILGAGLLAMTTRKIFRSAIFLLFSLIGIAALYFWLQVEFIAAVQIIVYVGGIVVLIIFSIFLTQQSGKEMPRQSPKRAVASVLAVLFGFGLTFLQIWNYNFQPLAKNFDWTVSKIGSQMLGTTSGGYALPFEVVSMLLLAAMVGCIVIAIKAPVPGGVLSDQLPANGKELEHPKKVIPQGFQFAEEETKSVPLEEGPGGTSL
ncbi:MAG TPA: NADH-quinone oxidoreductase subunit J [Chitinophagaceae bacterium]|nr:NADH-quinone oxidoreductase subunit J [Chitinophagaceae bacterium]